MEILHYFLSLFSVLIFVFIIRICRSALYVFLKCEERAEDRDERIYCCWNHHSNNEFEEVPSNSVRETSNVIEIPMATIGINGDEEDLLNVYVVND